jgi:ribosomal protein S27AE
LRFHTTNPSTIEALMTFSMDNHSLDIPCGKCGKKFKETIGRLKRNPKLTCGSCGAVTNVETDELRRVEQSIKKALDGIGKGFGKR